MEMWKCKGTAVMGRTAPTKILWPALLAVLFLFWGAVNAVQAGTVEEAFKKSFPKVPGEGFSETPIKGVYEVQVGNEILYYAPLRPVDGADQTGLRLAPHRLGRIFSDSGRRCAGLD